MKFGINVLNFGPAAAPEALAQWARFAEQTGFHLLMISDHVAITPDVQREYPTPFYDQFVSLSWLAAQTSKVELGTTVTVLPYRHPLLTARMAANLDRISGGRFILGVGAGWAKLEFEALGIPFEKRGAIAGEYLEAIRLCWANDVASFHGRHLSFRNVYTGPRPSRIPIWVGGSTDAALRRAVLLGDAWHPYLSTLDGPRSERLPRLRAIAEEKERPVPAFCPRLAVRLTPSALPERDRPAGRGSIDQVREDLAVLEALGAAYVLLDTYSGAAALSETFDRDLDTLARLAEEVLDLEHHTVR